jgi:hypothetical protein
VSPRQSPDPEPGRRVAGDLLAAARRRLPPEVDVVELAAGLLAGAVALGGCAPSPAEARAAATRSQAHVRAESRALLAGLAGLGAFPLPPQGAWSGCDDVGGSVLYHVTARLEPAAGAPPLVDTVRRRLAAAGVGLDEVPAAAADPVTLAGRRNGLHVQVTGYPARPEVLLDLSGRCLEVGDVDRDLLSRLPADLDLR